MAGKQGVKLVRYVSPFGSPAWMSPERAEEYRQEDDKIWCELLEIEAATGSRILSERQRQVGCPRIERGRR